MMKKSKFTLIEILLVISIIVLLTGMLIPAIQTARQRGKFSRWLTFSNNLRATPQMLAYYDFQDDANSSTLENRAFGFEKENYSQQKLNGAITKAQWGKGRWSGKSALVFNGIQSNVLLASSSTIGEVKGDFSVYMTIFPYKLTANCILLRFMQPNLNTWNLQLSLRSNRVRLDYRTYGNNPAPLTNRSTTFTFNLQPNRWQLIGLSYNSSSRQLSFYVDGQLRQQINVNGTIYNYIGQGYLGGLNTSGNSFNGIIDEFAFFNKDLTARDITNIHTMGAVY